MSFEDWISRVVFNYGLNSATIFDKPCWERGILWINLYGKLYSISNV